MSKKIGAKNQRLAKIQLVAQSHNKKQFSNDKLSLTKSKEKEHFNKRLIDSAFIEDDPKDNDIRKNAGATLDVTE